MKILKVRDVKTPVRGTGKSAGIDFFVPKDFEKIDIMPHKDILIPSGIKASIPEGYMLMAAEKSGVTVSMVACAKSGRTPKPGANEAPTVLGAKIVDEDYQGEIHIHVINVGVHPVTVAPDMKIAQFILVPVSYDDIEEVTSEEELYNGVETQRGDGGFGSTGEN